MDAIARGSEQPHLKLYDVKQTADLLCIKRTKLWRLVKDKHLPSLTIGRKRLFAASDLAAFIASRRKA